MFIEIFPKQDKLISVYTKGLLFLFSDFPTKTEQNFIFRRETGIACTKILSCFGKRMLTPTTEIPPSDFPTRDEEKQYPVSENPTAEI